MEAPRHAKTVLVVEDERGIRLLITTTLGRAGYVVLQADSAEAALGLVAGAAEPIDLLVTDGTLPGMSGYDLAEQLLTADPGLKALYVSGGCVGKVHEVPEALRPRCAFLPKPFPLDELLSKVHELLG